MLGDRYMYNNPYYRNYNATLNQQNMFDQIDNQINQLQDMKQQMRNNTTPAINQTFQLAPTNNSIPDCFLSIPNLFGDICIDYLTLPLSVLREV